MLYLTIFRESFAKRGPRPSRLMRSKSFADTERKRAASWVDR